MALTDGIDDDRLELLELVGLDDPLLERRFDFVQHLLGGLRPRSQVRADAPGHYVERQLATANREQIILQGRRLLHFKAVMAVRRGPGLPSFSNRTYSRLITYIRLFDIT
ncbi:MAG: hypothetical protein ACREXP_19295, partial [Steroidobacteraceae bacterium]